MSLAKKILQHRRKKVSFRQRFKEANTKQRIFLILKLMGLAAILWLITPEKTRKIAHKFEYGDYVTYDEETGQIISVQRGFYKNVNH